MGFRITIRDARFGRDPQFATDNGGEVLMVYESDVAVSYGDVITLPDGTSWPVVGLNKIVNADGVTITAHIGDTFP